jgi:hypothetical protein
MKQKLFLICLHLWSAQLFGDANNVHHQLAWVGYLRLPKAENLPSNMTKPQRPQRIEGWNGKNLDVLEWLPKARLQKKGLVAKYHIKFSDKKNQPKLGRREARKNF